MHGLDSLIEEGEDGTVFRDVIMLALLGFATIVILLLPHLHPPTEIADPVKAPGNIIVEARWLDNIDVDVDLWVEAPGDKPVGYSNKSGRIFNLLRDDLGNSGDLGALNYETAFTRGTPAGNYTVNLHLYRNNSTELPIEVEVQVSVKSSPDAKPVPISSKKIHLRHVGEETTVVRFALDENGGLVAGSLHQLPRPLRTSANGASNSRPGG